MVTIVKEVLLVKLAYRRTYIKKIPIQKFRIAIYGNLIKVKLL
ncbi:MAG: hypothetical protein ACTSRH_17380 [Promethearchaeota archaeon]